MSDVEVKKAKYVEKVRQQGERINELSWYERLGKKIEYYNKRLTYPLVGKLYGIPRLNRKLHPTELQNILFIRPDAIGDMIVSTPLWHILKRRSSELETAVAASFRNVDVIRTDPNISRIFSYDLFHKENLKTEMAAVREHNYEAVFLTKFDRKAYGAYICAKSTKTGYTLGLSSDDSLRYDLLFSRAPMIPPPHNTGHIIDQLISLLQLHFEIEDITVDERRPVLYIDPAVETAVRNSMENLLSENQCTSFIVLNTQARNEFLEWGYENSLQLATMLAERYPDLLILLTSSPQREDALLEYLRTTNTDKRIVYFPTPDLHQLFALVRLSQLVITPDTSIVHIASAENKPLVSFYPRSSHWAPYMIPSYMIIPPNGQMLATIPVSIALDAAVDLLDPKSETVMNSMLRTIHITP